MNRSNVDSYLAEGCGRCDKYQTPDCKVHLWTDELVALREMLLATELTEELKWGQPTYTLDDKNVIMIGSWKDNCSISFLQGVALDDPDGVLESPGPNSRYARLVRFRSMDDVAEKRDATTALIESAIAFKRSGVEIKVEREDEVPEELEERLASDPDLQAAFDDLTPGRQRSYYIYISGAKQSKTREARVERSIPKIYAGKGYNEY